MSKPRWKSAVELGLALVFVVVGCAWVDRAVNGGPFYYWIGLYLILISLRRVYDHWEEL